MCQLKMKEWCVFRAKVFIVIGLFVWMFSPTGFVEAKDAFSCGGAIETDVWQLWDGSVREYLRTQQLTKRLKEEGDTYALYDVQIYTDNLVAMAQRCQRFDRLEQLADLFGTAYAELAADTGGKAGLAWICKGGAVCNSNNGLLNHEVMLNSAQFLALTASVANGLAHAHKHQQSKFIEQTAITSIQHLLRWGDAAALLAIRKLLAARPQDVKTGSSDLFFTDKPLWMITIYADLAGLLKQQPELRAKAALTDDQLGAMREHLSLLLRLFSARITLMDAVGRSGRTVKVADLDRGFWRLYAGNKYAGYTGSEKPVTCISQEDAQPRIQVLLDAVTLSPVNDIGWDISHARRLVHAFDAIERNRQAMREVFGVEDAALPSAETMRAFAQQLIVHVWNGDAESPLFSNYWSGANGWYRVGYDDGKCREGYPPFSLSVSFATGGYASWSRYVPEIRSLGRRLYELSRSNNTAHRVFVDKYYPGLGANASASERMLTQLMFWPSLVEAP